MTLETRSASTQLTLPYQTNGAAPIAQQREVSDSDGFEEAAEMNHRTPILDPAPPAPNISSQMGILVPSTLGSKVEITGP